MLAGRACQVHLERRLSKTQLSRMDPCCGDVFAPVGGQEVQYGADERWLSWAQSCVLTGAMLGQ